MTICDNLEAGNPPREWIPAFEGVAKSIKALNHKAHKEHKGKEKLFFVLFVLFVVPFFSEPFATPSFARMTVSHNKCSDLSLTNGLKQTDSCRNRNIKTAHRPCHRDKNQGIA